ncbi:MAG: ATP-binding protein [Ignavibacteriae bacterium]|nr:MAG: ATP-binding protein [Ignavibacteriota bacterium]
MDQKVKKNFKKIFKSNPELMPEIEKYILNVVESSCLIPKNKYEDIEIAVAEAVANSILHGNKNDITKMVEVEINVTNTQLEISFLDQGKGFDPNAVPDPTTPENILKGSGRGIHIIKSIVDKLDFEFTNKGTKVKLIFLKN